MKKLFFIFLLLMISVHSLSECYGTAKPRTIDELDYEYNIINKKIRDYNLTTYKNVENETVKIYKDDNFIKLVIFESNVEKQKLYINDMDNILILSEDYSDKRRGSREKWYYNTCGELYKYVGRYGEIWEE